MDSLALLRETLVENLKSGTWRAGHRIPTERALCEQFGMGRSAVRRVLAQLKDAGLITQTVGSGTYVSDNIQSLLPGLASGTPLLSASPAELMEARMALEPAIVEMVVRNATPADFARMAQCCDQAEQAGTLDEFEHWDGLLHEVIAEAAHNTFISNVFRLMNQARAQVLAQIAGARDSLVSTPGLAALGLRTSMRNQLPCTVKRLKPQGPAMRVELALADGTALFSRITRESAQLLALHPGQAVLALCKATAVTVDRKSVV